MVKRKKIKSKKTKKVKNATSNVQKASKAKKVQPEKKQKLTKSKVCCTKCGECKGVSKDRMAKLIGQFGSIEDLHANYVCRKCRKEHNVRADGRNKPEKRKRKKSVLKKDANGVTILPEWMLGNENFGPVKYFKRPKDVSKKKFDEAVLAACKVVFKKD